MTQEQPTGIDFPMSEELRIAWEYWGDYQKRWIRGESSPLAEMSLWMLTYLTTLDKDLKLGTLGQRLITAPSISAASTQEDPWAAVAEFTTRTISASSQPKKVQESIVVPNWPCAHPAVWNPLTKTTTDLDAPLWYCTLCGALKVGGSILVPVAGPGPSLTSTSQRRDLNKSAAGYPQVDA